MSLLLDSNALLWWLADDPRLDPAIVERLRRENSVLVSVVTPWELWIKAATGKLRLPADFEERLERQGIRLVSPSVSDARLAARLPPIHRDPFDRMIIAQAMNAQAALVTGDRLFARYGCDVILV